MVAPSISAPSCAAITAATEIFVDTRRKNDIHHQNILAGCGVADAVRTSLGPKGMDKMIQTASREVIITNDGATILNKMEVLQSAAKMLMELSKSQDVVAGDGTTMVVLITGAFLKKLRFMLSKLYSAKGLSLKADALRSRAASVDVDDDLVSSSSRGGGGGLDDEDAEARVSSDVDQLRNGAAGDSECSCLPRGHMYGMSCIKKWLRKQKSSGKCPQCKKKCTLKDVRRMYGSRVVVIDEQSNK
ncbi:hypothetical protein Droror1_Dr00026760, partial [Drosera rotundifolia]